MRRSAAPSQSGAKRPRLENDNSRSQIKPVHQPPMLGQKKSVVRSSQDILQLMCQTQTTKSDENIGPVKTSTVGVNNEPQGSLAATVTESSTDRYYTVVWCKHSAKKHKEWKEDAIMIVKTRTVVLKNLEGKDIGQGSGYKLAQLQELESGSRLVVGGKEVMIQDQIPEQSYLNGTCFNKNQQSLSEEQGNISANNPKKDFSAPRLSSSVKLPKNSSGNSSMPKPRHNPNAPSAIVMPKPPPNILTSECNNGTVVVDVVIDPLLCRRLRPHQREGITFLYKCVMGFMTPNMYGAILADEMGLGKTLQCITLIWTLLHQGPYNGRPTISRVLVVTPSSLVKNWYKEFRRWLGTERINVFTADQQHRPIEFLKLPLYPVMVISYEMLVRCFDDVQRIKFDLIICDEGHRLKNAGNKTSSLISQLDCNRKILLTGTPVQNDLKEFWCLADFVNPGILGSLSSFRRTYEESIVNMQQPNCDDEQKETGEMRSADLQQITSQFILRRTQQVLKAHLPPKIECVVFCRPTAYQVKLYHSLLNSSCVRSLISSSSIGQNHLGFIQAMRRLCNHPSLFTTTEFQESQESDIFDLQEDAYGSQDFDEIIEQMSYENGQTSSEGTSGKFEVATLLVDSLMNSTKEKIVIVSYSTKMLDLLEGMCSKRDYHFLRLDGNTATNARMSLVDRFNDPSGIERVFLLSSKAGGVGLNLVGASRLIMYDIDWNPANDLQAMARIWRDGQKKTVRIYRLLTTGTIEEKIFQRQILKQGLSGAVVDARENAKSHFTKEELKDLFSLKEDTLCETHDLIKCPCDLQEDVKYSLTDTNEDFAMNDERSCRIGSQSNVDSNKTLDQLLEWQHFGPPFEPETFQDQCLESALSDISYVFRSFSADG